MRAVTVKGINDNIKLEFGSDVEIIYEIMQRGKAIDAITFELELSGKELVEFINEFNLNEKVDTQINEENKYIITAYDW